MEKEVVKAEDDESKKQGLEELKRKQKGKEIATWSRLDCNK
jgi:hypothetical protein